MSWEFKVGQKVVCVDDENIIAFQNENTPIKGRIYTIRSFYGTSIRLEEVINPILTYCDCTDECAFKPHRFRPLIEDTEYRSERLTRFLKDVLSNPKQVEVV